MVLSLLLSLVLMVTVFLGALNARHVRCRRDMYDMGRLFTKQFRFHFPPLTVLHDISKAHSIQVR